MGSKKNLLLWRVVVFLPVFGLSNDLDDMVVDDKEFYEFL